LIFTFFNKDITYLIAGNIFTSFTKGNTMPRKADPMTSLLKKYSAGDLLAAYEKKANQEKKRLPALKKKRSELQSKIDDLTAEIEAIESGSTAGAAAPARAPKKRRGRRPGRPPKKAAKKKAVRRGRPAGKKKAAKRGRPAAKKKSPGRPRGRAAKGKMTVRKAIEQVINDAKNPIGPTEIREAIQSKKLLSTPTDSLSKQISNALYKYPEFVRAKKGKYVVKH
jgi:hypothetical protein